MRVGLLKKTIRSYFGKMMQGRLHGYASISQKIGFLQWNIEIDCNSILWSNVYRIEDYHLLISQEWKRVRSQINVESLRLLVLLTTVQPKKTRIEVIRDMEEWNVSKELPWDWIAWKSFINTCAYIQRKRLKKTSFFKVFCRFISRADQDSYYEMNLESCV